MARLLFITHGDVEKDPDVPVPQWGLNARGRARHQAFAQSDAVAGVTSVFSSAETKATDGAEILRDHLKIPHHIVEDLHENDRSATGFLPEPEFQAVADAFFAAPEQSVRGWERAVDAQARVMGALRACVARAPAGDIAVVAHGGVGALALACLRAVPISRDHDQPGRNGGHYAVIDLPDWRLVHGWRDIAPEVA